MAAGHGQDVTGAAFFEVAAQSGIGAVDLIPGDPAGGHAGVQGAGEHPAGQCRLGRERCVFRDACRRAAGRFSGP